MRHALPRRLTACLIAAMCAASSGHLLAGGDPPKAGAGPSGSKKAELAPKLPVDAAEVGVLPIPLTASSSPARDARKSEREAGQQLARRISFEFDDVRMDDALQFLQQEAHLP